MNPRRTLVVYHSTQTVARMVGRALRCELEAITERDDHGRGLLGRLRAGLDATLGRPVALLPMRTDPRDYDLVVIGTPIWNASVSPAVRTYLDENRHSFPDVAFFCTHGGSGSARALRQMEALCGRTPVLTLVLRTEEVMHDTANAKVRAFASALAAPSSSGGLLPPSLRSVPA